MKGGGATEQRETPPTATPERRCPWCKFMWDGPAFVNPKTGVKYCSSACLYEADPENGDEEDDWTDNEEV